MDQLKSKIIDSLQFASEPSLTGCSFTFGVKEQTSLFNPSRVCSQGTMFRNQLSRYFTVIPESAFDSILCQFDCLYDPKTKSSSHQEFSSSVFQLIEGDALFKLAAKEEMTQSSNIVELSTKYQVLSDKTSFVGVVKQKEKSHLEMITVTQPKAQPEI